MAKKEADKEKLKAQKAAEKAAKAEADRLAAEAKRAREEEEARLRAEAEVPNPIITSTQFVSDFKTLRHATAQRCSASHSGHWRAHHADASTSRDVTRCSLS